MINFSFRTFISKIGIILMLFSMLILAGCPPHTQDYTFMGEVIMVNECTGDEADLSLSIRMVVNLYYKSGRYSPFEEEFAAIVTAPATRTATFTFTITSNEKADYWQIVYIFDGVRYLHPCELITCPPESPPSCRDVAQKVRRITVTNNVTNHIENINCSCI